MRTLNTLCSHFGLASLVAGDLECFVTLGAGHRRFHASDYTRGTLRRRGDEMKCVLVLLIRFVVAAILLAVPAVAQQQTGHVLSVETHKSHHTTSVYNSTTGQYSHGSGTSVERDTEIQVGNLVYESSQIHKDVQVGKDYPVTIETDKHGAAKKLTLVVGEKTCTYRIRGTREAKSN